MKKSIKLLSFLIAMPLLLTGCKPTNPTSSSSSDPQTSQVSTSLGGDDTSSAVVTTSQGTTGTSSTTSVTSDSVGVTSSDSDTSIDDQTSQDTSSEEQSSEEETSVPINVASVSLNKSTLTLVIGDTETLVATVLPVDANNKSVTWESSEPSTVSVDDGLVTALAIGKITITVTTTDGSFTDTCEVTVEIDKADDDPEEFDFGPLS